MSASSSVEYQKSLIEKSLYKRVRRSYSKVVVHVINTAPSLPLMQTILSYIRVAQFVGPSFINGRVERSPMVASTTNVISTVFACIPYLSDSRVKRNFAHGLAASLVIELCMLTYAAWSLKAKATVPKWLVMSLSFMFSMNAVIPPMSLINCISFYTVTASILGVSMFFFVTQHGLTFRPTTIMTLVPHLSGLFLILTALSSLIPLAHPLSFVFLYIVSILMPHLFGGFMKSSTTMLVIVSSLSGFFNLMMSTFCLYTNRWINLNLFFSMFAFLVLSCFGTRIYCKIDNVMRLRLCDSIDNSLENINFHTFLICAKVAFEHTHPLCVDWKVFRLGIEKWNRKGTVWMMFARYTSIYPEEQQLLQWISSTMPSDLIFYKEVKALCLSMTMNREKMMTAEIKMKLKTISLYVERTNVMLSRIWDTAMQCNLNEIESAILNFLDRRDKTNVALERLLMEYSSNPFVIDAYIKFCNDMGLEYTVDKFLGTDYSYKFGMKMFPNVPARVASVSSTAQHVVIQEPSQRKKTCIRITYKSWYRVLWILFAYVLIIWYYGHISNKLSEPIRHLLTLSRIRTVNVQALAFTNRLFMLSNGLSSDYPPSLDEVNIFGKTWDLRKQMAAVLSSLAELIQKIEMLSKFKSSNQNVMNSVHLVFGQSTFFSNYVDTENYMTIKTSIPAVLSDYIVQSSRYVDPSVTIDMSIFHSAAMINPLANSYNASFIINDAMDALSLYVEGESRVAAIKVVVYTISIVVISSIIFIVSIVHEVGNIKNRRLCVYKSFTEMHKKQLLSLTESLRKVDNDNTSQMTAKEIGILKIISAGAKESSNLVIDYCGILLIVLGLIDIVGAFTYIALKIKGLNTFMSEELVNMDDIDGAYAATLRAITFLSTMSALPVLPPLYTSFNLPPQFERAMMRRTHFMSPLKIKYITEENVEYQSIYDSIGAQLFMLYDTHVQPSDPFFGESFAQMVSPLYEKFFLKLITDDWLPPPIEYIHVFCAVNVIIEVLVFILLVHETRYLNSAFNILTHSCFDNIHQSKTALSVIDNQFSPSHVKSNDRGNEFYDELVSKMSDLIVVIDKDGKTKWSNCSKSKSTSMGLQFIESIRSDPDYEIELSLHEKYKIYTIRDVSNIRKLKEAIIIEKRKRDAMLKTVYPESFVKHLANSEKVCIRVQQISVVYIDLSTCHSDDIQSFRRAASTINGILLKYPCIELVRRGFQNYMVVGGLLKGEGKEAITSVEFSIDVLKKLKEFLQPTEGIKIGINFGGPAVELSLGGLRPSFEVMGHVVSEAKKLAESANPDYVHISRSVYEHIYGEKFNVTERCETLTYLVR